jgi:hypothetical protein
MVQIRTACGPNSSRARHAAMRDEIIPTFECQERLIADELAFERGWDVQNLRARVVPTVRGALPAECHSRGTLLEITGSAFCWL